MDEKDGRMVVQMKEDGTKRLSIAEKRAIRDEDKPVLEPDYDFIEGTYTVEPDWTRPIVIEANPKMAISLRVDPDVLEFFKIGGAGYQTRMNAVLRAYMAAQKPVTRR
jgi:uncharacterized protein (DUF4415 family)